MSTETTVVVEHVGPARKRLRITIPASVVDAGLKDAYSSARAEAQVPGFRRGTAPIALIEKRFGAAIVEDLRRKLLSEAYGKALQDHKLQPISDPEVDEKAGEPEVRRGTPLAVTLDVEIVPDITSTRRSARSATASAPRAASTAPSSPSTAWSAAPSCA
jgi:trigger factor